MSSIRHVPRTPAVYLLQCSPCDVEVCLGGHWWESQAHAKGARRGGRAGEACPKGRTPLTAQAQPRSAGTGLEQSTVQANTGSDPKLRNTRAWTKKSNSAF